MARTGARGRPRSFDADEKLAVIQQVFWKKGYAATSLDDLSEATGLTRPSLYAAWGNKTDLYLAAVNAFGNAMAEKAVPALYEHDDLASALEAFYARVLDVYFGNRKTSLGCMVFTSAVADAGDNAPVRKSVAGFLAGLDGALTEAVAHHVPKRSPEECTALGRIAAGGLMNIATRARAGAKRPELDELAKQMAELMGASAGKSH